MCPGIIGGNQELKLGKDYRLGRKGVASTSKRYSRKCIKKGVSGYKKQPIVIGTDEDERESSKYDGKATKREEVIKTKGNHFNDLEVGETSGNYCKGENVGASRWFGDNSSWCCYFLLAFTMFNILLVLLFSVVETISCFDLPEGLFACFYEKL